MCRGRRARTVARWVAGPLRYHATAVVLRGERHSARPAPQTSATAAARGGGVGGIRGAVSGELGSWAPATVEFTGDQLCAACCLWKRKSEAVGGWYFSSTRLAAKKLLLLSHLAVIGVLTCPLFGLCGCDVTLRTVVGDGTT